MSISLETVKEAIGAVHDMGAPAGFGVTGQVSGPPAPGATAVTVAIDPNSHAAAFAKNNSGKNKDFAKQSGAMKNGLQRQENGMIRHDNLLAQTGQDKTIRSVLSRGAGFASLRGYQASATPTSAPVGPQAMQPGKQNTLRRTFDGAKREFIRRHNQLMATPKTKTVALPLQQLKAKALAKAAPVKGRATQQPNVTAAFAKWGGALMDGSYIEGPRLKGNS